MYLLNVGSFTIKKKDEDAFIKLLVDYDVIESEEKVVVVSNSDETVIVDLDSECYGDLEDALSSLTKDCVAAGISVDGLITYSGDYQGVYEIDNGEFSSYDIKDYIVKDALTTKKIISPDLKKEIISLIDQIGNLLMSYEKTDVQKLLNEVFNILENTEETQFLPVKNQEE